MRLSSIALASLLLAACAEGVYEDYTEPLDSGLRDSKTSGSGGSNSTGGSGGSGGSGATGGSSTGGSGGKGGSGATGGSGGTGGTGGSGGTGGTGGSGGAAGGGGSGGSSGSAGKGGTGGGGGASGATGDAGAGCPGTVDWMMGGTYAMGDKVRAVCSTADSGSGTMCTVGKTYSWSCSLALACGFVGPGTANWGLAWTLGTQCN